MVVDREIDVVGKACPIPLITAAREVRAMKKGQVLRISGNDPLFETTMVDFCREGGHRIKETLRAGKTVTITLQV